MNNPRSKEEAASLAATLQNAAEPLETRRIALDALLSASRQETACSALCSAGAVHSAFVAIKASQGEPPVLIESALSLLSNLSKFDSKLVSVVARLQVVHSMCSRCRHQTGAVAAHALRLAFAPQGGIVALLEAIREQLSMASSDLADRALQHALLRSLSDVTHSLQNAQLVAKENGITVILGCVLSHLKDESIVLPALQVGHMSPCGGALGACPDGSAPTDHPRPPGARIRVSSPAARVASCARRSRASYSRRLASARSAHARCQGGFDNHEEHRR